MKNARILRTRDESLLARCDCVVDVGAQYDPLSLRFDHHQPEFSQSYSDASPYTSTKLSSAGLIWKHFGATIVRDILGWHSEHASDERVSMVEHKVYRSFMHEIDAVDNGVSRFDVDATVNPPKYEANTHLAARIGRLNPGWNSENNSEDTQYKMFQQAMQRALEEAREHVFHAAHQWLPARDVVDAALAHRWQHDRHGRIMVLSNGGVPWKDLLFELESPAGSVLYVIYEDATGGTWRLQCAPQTLGTFNNRLPLPSHWAGLRGEELSKAAAIDGCVFCHPGRFIAGNYSFEGAKKMADEAIRLAEY